MNIYFLVEGKSTESIVYPYWINYLIPKLKQVEKLSKITENNFYLVEGNGYPSIIYNHLKDAIETINDINKFDYFVLCLDCEDVSLKDRTKEINDYIKDEKLILRNCKFQIIIQNCCIETWFLGNRNVFPRFPQEKTFTNLVEFYNVYQSDPELMDNNGDFSTKAKFHLFYLKEMFKERNKNRTSGTNRLTYNKNNPGDTIKPYYIDDLQKRIKETNHLNSLTVFFDFCNRLNKLCP